MINIIVDITASHLGHFEFRLCNKSSATELVTQECLDRNLLKLADGSTKSPVSNTGQYYVTAQLPSDVTCDYCVIQWKYKAGWS